MVSHWYFKADEQHEMLGMISAWGFGLLVVWAYLRQKSEVLLEKMGFVTLFIGFAVVLGYGAHLGGKMVYEKGAGIAPMEQHLMKLLDTPAIESVEDNDD